MGIVQGIAHIFFRFHINQNTHTDYLTNWPWKPRANFMSGVYDRVYIAQYRNNAFFVSHKFVPSIPMVGQKNRHSKITSEI